LKTFFLHFGKRQRLTR